MMSRCVFSVGGGVLSRCNGQDTANIAWAFGKASKSSNHRFAGAYDAIARHATPLVLQRDALTEQHLANLAGAFAAASHPAPEFFSAVRSEAIRRLDGFAPQGLAILVWAFVKQERQVSYSDGGGKTIASGSASTDNMSSETGRNGDNPVRSSNNLDSISAALVTHLVERRARDLGRFQPQALSTLMWALAEAGRRDEQLFDMMGREVTRRGFRGFNSQDIAYTVGGLATARRPQPELFSCLSDLLVRRDDWSDFTPQALSTTLWAYATLRHRSAPLFDAVAGIVLGHDTAATATAPRTGLRLSRFSPHDISLTLWAFAALSQPFPRLFDAVHALILEPAFLNDGGDHHSKSDKWSTRQISMTLWAYAVFDRADIALVRAMTESIPEPSRRGRVGLGLDPVIATQLFQVGLSARRSRSGSENIGDERKVMSSSLEDAARAHWGAQTARGAQLSQLQLAVVDAARRLGIPATPEWVTPDGIFSVDVMLDVPGGPLAVEVNGPLHYSINLASDAVRNPLGATVLRLRLLEPHVAGRLLSIPFYEWNALQSPEQQEEYLLRQIKPFV
jgi:hypothetical protein